MKPQRRANWIRQCLFEASAPAVALLGLTLLGACDIKNAEDDDGDAAVGPSLDADLGSALDAAGRDDASSSGDGAVASQCQRPGAANEAFTRAALLRAAGQCATFHYCEAHEAASTLEQRLGAYRSAPGDDTRRAARDAFRAAMERWSAAELFQFGPAATRVQDAAHGEGIRNLIYAWPNTSRCRVEEQVASQAYLSSGVAPLLVNGRGLFAIEYALFYEGADHGCLPSSQAAMTWPSLGDELAARKLDYAVAVAADVTAQTRDLWQRFGPGGFTDTLAGAIGYPNEQEALNTVAWSLVYVEKEVKDWKLGVPAGYSPMAPISGPETPFALLGTENVRANLRGFRALFQGCGPEGEGLGFDDWLISAGHQELATAMIDALRGAQAAADAMPPLNTASPAELEQLYRAVKALTDLLKNEFFGAGSPLNLKLPSSIGSDTD